MSDNDNGELKQELAPLLVQYQKGLAHDKMSQELRDAVTAVQEMGKPAEVNIKIRVSPVSGNPRVVQTLVTSTAKIPKPAPAPSIFFADEHGALHRNDPLQNEFDFTRSAAADGKSAAAGRD